MFSRNTLARARRHWPVLLPVVLGAAVFHAWLVPGDIIGADWVRRVPEELNSYFPWPHVWNGAQQMGETNQVYLFSFPLFSLAGLLSRLNVPWSAIERLLYLWPYLILSIAAPYAFAYRISRSPIAGAVAASLFCLNSWIIMATERGAIPSIVAASLMPLFFLAVLSFIDRATPRRGMGLALLLTAILIYDLRYVYISVFFAFVLALEQLLRDRSFSRIKSALPSIAVAIVTLAVTNIFWLLPQFFEAANAGAGYGSLQDYIGNSHFMSPAHSLADFAVFYHWIASNNPFRPDQPDWYFFLIPVAVFGSFAACWKRKWMWSFAVGAFASLLLDSGPTFPVDGVNIWIFTHVPGMSLFRDVTKWMSLLEFTYGVVLGLGVARLRAYLTLLSRKFNLVQAGAVAVPIIAVALYAAIMNDAFNVMRFRVFATYHVAPDTLALEQFIASRPRGERVLVIPRDSEPMRAVLDHPFAEAMQLENSASPDGLRHLNMSWNDLFGMYSAPYAADLLRTLNIHYVVVPYDYDKIIYSPYIANQGYFDVLDFMRNQHWLRLERIIGRQAIFAVRGGDNHEAFVAPYPFILNGTGPGLAALAGTPLVNPRMAAVLPDQPLGDLAKRVSNYASAGWAIDENLNDPADVSRYIARVKALDRADASRAFQYSVKAASTASSSDNIVWLDDPTLLNSTFSWNRTSANYVATLQNAGPAYANVLDVTHRLGTPKRVTLAPETIEATVDEKLHATRKPGLVIVENQSPFTLRGKLVLSNLSGHLTLAAKNVPGRLWNCDSPTCTLDAVTLQPGRNYLIVKSSSAMKNTADVDPQVLLSDERPSDPVSFDFYSLTDRVSMEITKEPVVSLVLPPSRGLEFVAYELVNRWDGSRRYFMDQVTDEGYLADITAPLDRALTGHFARTLAEHARDSAWLFKNRLPVEPDGSSAWNISRVWLAVPEHEQHPRDGTFHLSIDGMPRDPVVALGAWPIHASRFAIPLEPSFAPGTKVIERRSLPGLLDLRLTSSAHPHLAFVTSGRGEWLSFDVYVDAGTSVHFSLKTAAKDLLFSEDLLSETPDRVYAGGRMISLGRATARWSLDVPHSERPMGSTNASTSPRDGGWKHFELRPSAFRPDPDEYRLVFDVQPLRGHAPVRFAIANMHSQTMLAQNVPPALLLDNDPLPRGTRDTLTDSGLIRIAGSVSLKHDEHHAISSYPTYPVRPAALVLQSGAPKKFDSAALSDVHVFNDAEIEGRISTNGGLLVYDQAYDPMWRAAIVPDRISLTGVALIDASRLQPYFVSRQDHYKVDDILNGWWIPSGNHRVVFFMALDTQLQAGAAIWIIVSILWIAAVLTVTARVRNA